VLTNSFRWTDVNQIWHFKVCFLALIVFRLTSMFMFSLKCIWEVWINVMLRGWYIFVESCGIRVWCESREACRSRQVNPWYGILSPRTCCDVWTYCGTVLQLDLFLRASQSWTVTYFDRACRSHLRESSILNHLTPNGHFSGHTAPLTYRCCIFYLFNRHTYWIF
jgi:hypothetical protein